MPPAAPAAAQMPLARAPPPPARPCACSPEHVATASHQRRSARKMKHCSGISQPPPPLPPPPLLTTLIPPHDGGMEALVPRRRLLMRAAAAVRPLGRGRPWLPRRQRRSRLSWRRGRASWRWIGIGLRLCSSRRSSPPPPPHLLSPARLPRSPEIKGKSEGRVRERGRTQERQREREGDA